MSLDTENLLQLIAGAAGLLITGGGLKTLADSWLAKRKGDTESEKQVFDQSLSLNQGLAVRVGVLEAGLKDCQNEHANCRYEMGLVKGQMLELQRQVDRNAQRLDETVASVVASNDSGVIEHKIGRMVGLGDITPHKPEV